jgi:PiT family inorganic phosphate transporter
MMTVGKGLFRLTPVTALVVVLAEGIVLFLFASQSLESWLASHGLPTIPLVPVSSSQAVIGAVIGIAAVKGGRGVRYSVLGKVAGGWAATPAIAAVLAFMGLFFLQNVFGLDVARAVPFTVSGPVLERLADEGITSLPLEGLEGQRFANAREFKVALMDWTDLERGDISTALKFARTDSFFMERRLIEELDSTVLTEDQIGALRVLSWEAFSHEWQLRERLVAEHDDWALLQDTASNREHNRALKYQLSYVYDTFRVPVSSDTR